MAVATARALQQFLQKEAPDAGVHVRILGHRGYIEYLEYEGVRNDVNQQSSNRRLQAVGLRPNIWHVDVVYIVVLSEEAAGDVGPSVAASIWSFGKGALGEEIVYWMPPSAAPDTLDVRISTAHLAQVSARAAAHLVEGEPDQLGGWEPTTTLAQVTTKAPALMDQNRTTTRPEVTTTTRPIWDSDVGQGGALVTNDIAKWVLTAMAPLSFVIAIVLVYKWSKTTAREAGRRPANMFDKGDWQYCFECTNRETGLEGLTLDEIQKYLEKIESAERRKELMDEMQGSKGLEVHVTKQFKPIDTSDLLAKLPEPAGGWGRNAKPPPRPPIIVMCCRCIWEYVAFFCTCPCCRFCAKRCRRCLGRPEPPQSPTKRTSVRIDSRENFVAFNRRMSERGSFANDGSFEDSPGSARKSMRNSRKRSVRDFSGFDKKMKTDEMTAAEKRQQRALQLLAVGGRKSKLGNLASEVEEDEDDEDEELTHKYQYNVPEAPDIADETYEDDDRHKVPEGQPGMDPRSNPRKGYRGPQFDDAVQGFFNFPGIEAFEKEFAPSEPYYKTDGQMKDDYEKLLESGVRIPPDSKAGNSTVVTKEKEINFQKDIEFTYYTTKVDMPQRDHKKKPGFGHGGVDTGWRTTVVVDNPEQQEAMAAAAEAGAGAEETAAELERLEAEAAEEARRMAKIAARAAAKKRIEEEAERASESGQSSLVDEDEHSVSDMDPSEQNSPKTKTPQFDPSSELVKQAVHRARSHLVEEYAPEKSVQRHETKRIEREETERQDDDVKATTSQAMQVKDTRPVVLGGSVWGFLTNRSGACGTDRGPCGL
eukprot:gnl/TRDRNA2_/TRDRNA2_79146_c0_seq1.p1 gnl/TRDRNA2_/TRDRNA2_79146_c0~~gnl/TRDRNA2_/TRDRNA2_79146_c0_seq1.p1  ORF type:complete len:944 (-),score=178.44 gnl/TRDRNA2_/TRDRNA2_79146_c0_seq1:65-2518(-)